MGEATCPPHHRSEALLAVGGAEGAQLHGRLGGHHLGRPVRRDVDALGLLLFDLLLDPEVGEPQPILRTCQFTGRSGILFNICRDMSYCNI